ncbi:MAG: hypothetical protein LBT85_01680 [Bifidobacteriaceae bacterium]|jgi:alpha-tubulin suppressor-like RCC1 family protein|nr:hypothetical protein [Bifidobacteriaceae bacterium]
MKVYISRYLQNFVAVFLKWFKKASLHKRMVVTTAVLALVLGVSIIGPIAQKVGAKSFDVASDLQPVGSVGAARLISKTVAFDGQVYAGKQEIALAVPNSVPQSEHQFISQVAVEGAKQDGQIRLSLPSDKTKDKEGASGQSFSYAAGDSSQTAVFTSSAANRLEVKTSSDVRIKIEIVGYFASSEIKNDGSISDDVLATTGDVAINPGGTKLVEPYPLLDSTIGKGLGAHDKNVILPVAGLGGLPSVDRNRTVDMAAVWLNVQTRGEGIADKDKPVINFFAGENADKIRFEHCEITACEQGKIEVPITNKWTSSLILVPVGQNGQIAYSAPDSVKDLRISVNGWVRKADYKTGVVASAGGFVVSSPQDISLQNITDTVAKGQMTQIGLSKQKVFEATVSQKANIPMSARTVLAQITLESKGQGSALLSQTADGLLSSDVSRISLINGSVTANIQLPILPDGTLYLAVPNEVKILKFQTVGYVAPENATEGNAAITFDDIQQSNKISLASTPMVTLTGTVSNDTKAVGIYANGEFVGAGAIDYSTNPATWNAQVLGQPGETELTAAAMGFDNSQIATANKTADIDPVDEQTGIMGRDTVLMTGDALERISVVQTDSLIFAGNSPLYVTSTDREGVPLLNTSAHQIAPGDVIVSGLNASNDDQSNKSYMQRVVSIEYYVTKTVVFTSKALTDDALMQTNIDKTGNQSIPLLSPRSASANIAKAPVEVVDYEHGSNPNAIDQLSPQRSEMLTENQVDQVAQLPGSKYKGKATEQGVLSDVHQVDQTSTTKPKLAPSEPTVKQALPNNAKPQDIGFGFGISGNFSFEVSSQGIDSFWSGFGDIPGDLELGLTKGDCWRSSTDSSIDDNNPGTGGRTGRGEGTDGIGSDMCISGGVDLSFSFALRFNFGLQIGIQWKWGFIPLPAVNRFMIAAENERSMEMSLWANGQLSSQIPIPLPTQEFAPIVFQAGPVPIMIFVELDPDIGLFLSLGGGAISEGGGVNGHLFEYTKGIESRSLEGQEYIRGQGWHAIKEKESNETGSSAKVNINFTAAASAGITLSVKLYKIAGPYIKAYVAFTFMVSVSVEWEDPCAGISETCTKKTKARVSGGMALDFDLGVSAGVSIEVMGWSLLDYSVSLYQFHWRIFEKSYGDKGEELLPECSDTDDNGNSLCPPKQVKPDLVSSAYTGPGSVITWGENKNGEQGVGYSDVGARARLGTVVDITQAKSVVGGQSTNYALSTDGKVAAWGSNEYGALGSGDWGKTKSERPVWVVDGEGKAITKIVKILASGDTAYAMTREGEVYTWGRNDKGQFGNGQKGTYSAWAIKIPSLQHIKDIAAGQSTVYALRSDNKIFVWGDVSKGQIISSDSQTPILTPYDISSMLPKESYSDIYASDKNLLLHESNNKLFIFGNSQSANRYLSSDQQCDENNLGCAAKEIIQPDDMQKYFKTAAFAGDNLILNYATGDVWAAGLNSHNEVSKTKDQSGNYIQARALYKVDVLGITNIVGSASKIDRTAGTVLALTSDGKVVAWGANEYNQTGINDSASFISPNIVNAKIANSISGIGLGSANGFAIRSEKSSDDVGHLWASGSNANSLLGTGVSNSVPVDKPVRSDEITQQAVKVASNESASYALLKDGSLVGWGNNDKCQLAIVINGVCENIVKSSPVAIMLSSPAKDVVAAGNYAAVITTDNKVYIWGTLKEGGVDANDGFYKTPTEVQKYKAPFRTFTINGLSAASNTLLLSYTSSNILWFPDYETYYLGKSVINSDTSYNLVVNTDVEYEFEGGVPSVPNNDANNYNASLVASSNGYLLAISGSIYVLGSSSQGLFGIDSIGRVYTKWTKLRVPAKSASNPAMGDYTRAIRGGDVTITWNKLVEGDSVSETEAVSCETYFSGSGQYDSSHANDDTYINSHNYTTSLNASEEKTWVSSVGSCSVVYTLKMEDFSGNVDKIFGQGSSVYALSKDGVLYGWGSSPLGPDFQGESLQNSALKQYPNPSTNTSPCNVSFENKSYLVCPVQISSVQGIDIRKVARTAETTYVLDSANMIYLLGEKTFSPVVNLDDVKDIYTGLNNAYFIRQSDGSQEEKVSLTRPDAGKLYAAGNNISRQIGLDNADQDYYMFSNVTKAGDSISQVVSDDGTSFAVTSSGDVYAFGDPGDALQRYGKVCKSTADQVVACENMVKISNDNFKDVVKIVTKKGSTLALTADGKLYAWGSNTKGYLGNRLVSGLQPEPVLVNNIPSLKDISITDFGVAALSVNGVPFAWGQGSEILTKSTGNNYLNPRVITFLTESFSSIDKIEYFSKAIFITVGSIMYAYRVGDGQNCTDYVNDRNNSFYDRGSDYLERKGFFSPIFDILYNNMMSDREKQGQALCYNNYYRLNLTGLFDTVDGASILQTNNGYLLAGKSRLFEFTSLEDLAKTKETSEGYDFYYGLKEQLAGEKIDLAASGNSGQGDSVLAASTSQKTLFVRGINSQGQLGKGDTLKQDNWYKLDNIGDVKSLIVSDKDSAFFIGKMTDLSVKRTENEVSGYSHVWGARAAENSVDDASVPRAVAIDKSPTTDSEGNCINGASKDVATGECKFLIGGQVLNSSEEKTALTASHIVGGDGANYAIASDGVVYAWGSNEYGQLGNTSLRGPDSVAGFASKNQAGQTDEFVQKTPVAVDRLNHIDDIESAGHTAYALREDGTVYAWGKNDYGQLGANDEIGSDRAPVMKYRTYPNIVWGLRNIEQIASGEHNGYALDSAGNLYAWGANDKGQLGIGIADDRVYTRPQLNLALVNYNIIKIEAAGDSIYALDAQGNIHSWGDNTKDQLGLYSYEYEDVVSEPTIIPDFKVADIDVSEGWVVAKKMSDSQLYGWGDNTGCKISIERISNRAACYKAGRVSKLVEPTLLTLNYYSDDHNSDNTSAPAFPIKQFAINDDSTYMIDANGRLFVISPNQNGEAGIGANTDGENVDYSNISGYVDSKNFLAMPDLNGSQIRYIRASGHSAYALFDKVVSDSVQTEEENGFQGETSVYNWGNVSGGNLAIPEEAVGSQTDGPGLSAAAPESILRLANAKGGSIIQIAFMTNKPLGYALLDNGEVLQWVVSDLNGISYDGVVPTMDFSQVPEGEKIASLSAGADYVIGLTNAGRMVIWGTSSSQTNCSVSYASIVINGTQCGDISKPVVINKNINLPNNLKVKKVVAGNKAFAYLTADYNAYMVYLNRPLSAPGSSTTFDNTVVYKVGNETLGIEDFHDVEDIYGGYDSFYFKVARDYSDTIIASHRTLENPQAVNSHDGDLNRLLMKDNTAKNDKAFAIANNFQTTFLKADDIEKIWVSNTNIYVLDYKGRLYSAGKVDNLNTDDSSAHIGTLYLMPNLPAGIKDLAAGSDVVAAIDEADRLYVWGKNEFGQFANGKINSQLAKSAVQVESVLNTSAKQLIMSGGGKTVYLLGNKPQAPKDTLFEVNKRLLTAMPDEAITMQLGVQGTPIPSAKVVSGELPQGVNLELVDGKWVLQGRLGAHLKTADYTPHIEFRNGSGEIIVSDIVIHISGDEAGFGSCGDDYAGICLDDNVVSSGLTYTNGDLANLNLGVAGIPEPEVSVIDGEGKPAELPDGLSLEERVVKSLDGTADKKEWYLSGKAENVETGKTNICLKASNILGSDVKCFEYTVIERRILGNVENMDVAVGGTVVNPLYSYGTTGKVSFTAASTSTPPKGCVSDINAIISQGDDKKLLDITENSIVSTRNFTFADRGCYAFDIVMNDETPNASPISQSVVLTVSGQEPAVVSPLNSSGAPALSVQAGSSLNQIISVSGSPAPELVFAPLPNGEKYPDWLKLEKTASLGDGGHEGVQYWKVSTPIIDAAILQWFVDHPTITILAKVRGVIEKTETQTVVWTKPFDFVVNTSGEPGVFTECNDEAKANLISDNNCTLREKVYGVVGQPLAIPLGGFGAPMPHIDFKDGEFKRFGAVEQNHWSVVDDGVTNTGPYYFASRYPLTENQKGLWNVTFQASNTLNTVPSYLGLDLEVNDGSLAFDPTTVPSSVVNLNDNDVEKFFKDIQLIYTPVGGQPQNVTQDIYAREAAGDNRQFSMPNSLNDCQKTDEVGNSFYTCVLTAKYKSFEAKVKFDVYNLSWSPVIPKNIHMATPVIPTLAEAGSVLDTGLGKLANVKYQWFDLGKDVPENFNICADTAQTFEDMATCGDNIKMIEGATNSSFMPTYGHYNHYLAVGIEHTIGESSNQKFSAENMNTKNSELSKISSGQAVHTYSDLLVSEAGYVVKRAVDKERLGACTYSEFENWRDCLEAGGKWLDYVAPASPDSDGSNNNSSEPNSSNNNVFDDNLVDEKQLASGAETNAEMEAFGQTAEEKAAMENNYNDSNNILLLSLLFLFLLGGGFAFWWFIIRRRRKDANSPGHFVKN